MKMAPLISGGIVVIANTEPVFTAVVIAPVNFIVAIRAIVNSKAILTSQGCPGGGKGSRKFYGTSPLFIPTDIGTVSGEWY